MCCRWDWRSVLARLLRCLWWGLLKRGFLGIYLTTSFRVRNFGNAECLRVTFFWKCSEFFVDFKNAQKNREQVFCFWDKCIWICCIKLSLLAREYLSPAVNVLTNSLQALHVRPFPTQLPAQWSMNMVKVLSLRLKQCFDPFATLPVQEYFGMGLFRRLCNHVFLSPEFSKYISYEGFLCLKISKIWCRFEKCTKKLTKRLLFFR